MRVLYYVAFIFFAIPIDVALDLVGGIRGEPSLLYRPFGEALIYVYAFVLAAEALFRVSQHVHVLERKRHLHLLIVAAGVVVAFFFLDYVPNIRPDLIKGDEVAYSWPTQVFVLFLALTVSVWSYTAIEAARNDMSSKRIWPT